MLKACKISANKSIIIIIINCAAQFLLCTLFFFFFSFVGDQTQTSTRSSNESFLSVTNGNFTNPLVFT